MLQIICLLTVGLLLRVYAFNHTLVINSDGVLYIDQARVILSGNWKGVKECGFDFVSLYHLLIAALYRVFGDWIVTAKTISIFFGALSAVPFYYIVKQFYGRSTTFIVSLAFTANPFFVARSVDIIKDPLFWFFALLGILFVILTLNSKGRDYLLLLSSLSFMAASLARIEVLAYVIGTALYLLFCCEQRTKRLFLLGIPWGLLCIAIFVGFAFSRETLSLWEIYFLPRSSHFFSGLAKEVLEPGAWERSLRAFKLLFSHIEKLTYLAFLPFLFIGFCVYPREQRRVRHFRYLLLLALLSVPVLYLFYLKFEILSPRYVVLFILPAFVFLGSGIEIVSSLVKRDTLKKALVVFLCLYVILSSLLADFTDKREDKRIYREIGEYIAQREDNKAVVVMAPDTRIMFYANLHAPAPECANRLNDYDQLKHKDYREMVSLLREKKVRYFVWEKSSWEGARTDFPAVAEKAHFRSLMRWESPHGEFVAYKLPWR